MTNEKALLSSEIDFAAQERHRIARMVHEAYLTLYVTPRGGVSSGGGSCWPVYQYQPGDWGYNKDLVEGEKVDPRSGGIAWTPTPRQIDELDVVLEWIASWQGRDRNRRGFHRWEHSLLESCALNLLRSEWAGEDWMKVKAHMATIGKLGSRSIYHWKREATRLQEVLFAQARASGEAKI